MSFETPRIALIGAGTFAAETHYPALVDVIGAHVVGFCDVSPRRRAEVSRRFGLSEYDDIETMLDHSRPEAVVILLPPKLLTDVATSVMARGIHVLMEKPPGVRLVDTQSMQDVAAQNDVVAMVSLNRRWTPVLRHARDVVAARGPIHLAVAEYHKHLIGQSPYWGTDSWLAVDQVHALDTLLWLGNDDIDVLSSTRQQVAGAAETNCYTAQLRFTSGAVGIHLASQASGIRRERVEMHGAGIAAYVDPPGRAVIYADGAEEPVIVSAGDLRDDDRLCTTYGFVDQHRHFLACLAGRAAPETDMVYATRLMALVAAIDGDPGSGSYQAMS